MGTFLDSVSVSLAAFESQANLRARVVSLLQLASLGVTILVIQGLPPSTYTHVNVSPVLNQRRPGTK